MTASTPPKFKLEPRWTETPGADWLVRIKNGPQVTKIAQPGVLDEVSVDHWLHMEQMDDRSWWLRIGDAWMMATIDEAGRVTVNIVRGSYGDVRGTTGTHPEAVVADSPEPASED